MADEDPTAAAAEAPKLKLPLPILILVLLGPLLGGVAVAMPFLFPPSAHEAGDGKEKPKAEKKEGHGEGGEGKKEGKEGEARPIVKLDAITVRLRNPEVDRYLRATVNVELKEAGQDAILKSEQPKVQDAIVSVLMDRTSEDLTGSAGLQKLRAELYERVEKILGKDVLNAIYITEFVVQ